jgi:hypothetical protein
LHYHLNLLDLFHLHYLVAKVNFEEPSCFWPQGYYVGSPLLNLEAKKMRADIIFIASLE